MISEFTLILLLLPSLTLLISFILELIIRKKKLVIGIIFLIYLLATFTIFNSTFLIWVFIYTILAFIGTLFADLIIKFIDCPFLFNSKRGVIRL